MPVVVVVVVLLLLIEGWVEEWRVVRRGVLIRRCQRHGGAWGDGGGS